MDSHQQRKVCTILALETNIELAKQFRSFFPPDVLIFVALWACKLSFHLPLLACRCPLNEIPNPEVKEEARRTYKC